MVTGMQWIWSYYSSGLSGSSLQLEIFQFLECVCPLNQELWSYLEVYRLSYIECFPLSLVEHSYLFWKSPQFLCFPIHSDFLP